MSNPNYEYVCIECGVREVHNRRFFPLDELLRIFVLPLPGAANNLRDYLRAALPAFRVGALFGGQVLGTEVLTRQADSQKDFSASPDDMMEELADIRLLQGIYLAVLFLVMMILLSQLFRLTDVLTVCLFGARNTRILINWAKRLMLGL